MLNVQFEDTDDGVHFTIAVNERHCGVLVESITMFVSTYKEDEDDEFWGDGDLAVNYSIEGLENTGGGDMGTLIMRGWDDELGTVMRKFYSEEAFTGRLREILIAHGFSAEAAANVNGSEWGMQDEGRASYDAYEIADEVRKHLGVA